MADILIATALLALSVGVVVGHLVAASRATPAPHIHEWAYTPRSFGGWGVAVCKECGEEDLY